MTRRGRRDVYGVRVNSRRDLRSAFAGVSRGDVAVALVVALVGQQEVWLPASGFSAEIGPRPAVSVAYWIASFALMWRRRAPLSVLVVVAVALSADYLAFGAPEGMGSLLPPVIAFYSVGRYADTRRFLVGLAVAVVHLVVHEVRDPQFSFDGPTVVFWAILIGVGFLGMTLRARASEVREAAQRAERAEARREDQDRQVIAAERARLAGELHDIVGHGLSLIVLQLVAVDGLVDKGDLESARRKLATLENTARQTLAETRRLVQVADADGERDSDRSPRPGLADIAGLVADVSRAGARVELCVSGHHAAVSTGLGLTAYRVVQEALTNVVRHARPAVARVVLEASPDRLTVEVTDQGVDVPLPGEAGHGLRGMRERVLLYGGSFDASPLPEGGFRVHAAFPLPEATP
jgi:signal transduction histidine kinase